MKRIVVCFALLLLYSVVWAATLTSNLQDKLVQAGSNDLLSIIIVMNEQYDTQALQQNARSMTMSDRRAYVMDELQSFSEQTQASVLAQLKTWEKQGRVQHLRSLWITNVITCEATPAVIRSLGSDPDIDAITLEEKQQVLDPRERDGAQIVQGMPGSREITWNVSYVNADDVWALGYTGSGVLVAVIDTGVNYNHTDLADHVWSGGTSYPYHGYDFANSDNNPMDDNGHGTHCAGTVAGDGTSGSQTGVAPDATIMALKVLDSGGSGDESDVWSAVQFAITNGADVISMSLGWQHSWGPTRATWRAAFVNALSAGIVAAVAAGNEGDETGTYPIPDNVRTPGDCPPPWLHPDQTLTGGLSSVVCVGAVDNTDTIAYFSSLGPCTWSGITGYNDYASGIQLIRPDVTSPGVSIKSLDYSSNTAYADGWSGTSMATPCVAGIMALMLSKNATITPAQVDQILEENSVALTATKSNTYGAGRVDALASVNAVSIGTDPPNAAANPTPTNGAMGVLPPTRLTWNNGGGAASYTVYCGTNNGAPWNILNGTTVTSPYVDVTGLAYDQQYYWKVDSYNSYGSAEGSIWNFITCGAPDESFETGDFTQFSWTFSGNANWTVGTDAVYSGTYSAGSGTITHNQSSSLSLNMDVTSAGTISFARKVSSESGYDYLSFYIDSTLQAQWSGTVDWALVSYSVSAGNHTFTWTYSKDVSVNSGSDKGWIDFIFLPPSGAIEPNIVVSPTNLNFGSVAVGSTYSMDFTIYNTGTGGLTGTITTPTAFTVAESRNMMRNTLSFSVAAGSSETYPLTFAPTAASTYSGNVVITSNDPDTPTVNVAVTGSGTMPADIVVSPSSINRSLEQNQSTAVTVNIGNAGVADLHYTASSGYTRNARDVLVESSFETSVPPTGWTTEILSGSTNWAQSAYPYTGSYAALATWNGLYDARLITPSFTATSDCVLSFWLRTQDTPTYGGYFDVEVSSDGSTWTSIASYEQDDFTQTYVQITLSLAAYDDQSIRVAFRAWENYWGDGVFIDDVVISGTPLIENWLSLSGNTSGTVTQGETAQLTVNLDSSDLDEGVYTGQVVINSDDPDEASVAVPVSFTVTAGVPQVVVTPAILYFGDVLVSQQATLPFQVSNPGTGILTGTIVTPAGYTVSASARQTVKPEVRTSQRNTLDFQVIAGGNKTFNLVFEPTESGDYANSLILYTSAGDSSISLLGSGVAPLMAVIPDSLYMLMEADTTATQEITVRNDGTAPLTWQAQYNTARGSGGPDTFGYTWEDSNEAGGPTYSWVDIVSSGTALTLSDDSYVTIALPFAFPFYGVEYTSINIASNGYLTFNNESVAWSNSTIPNASTPNNYIAPYWDDMEPLGNDGTYDWGTVYYRIDVAEQRLVVQYENVAHYNSTAPTTYETFEVILYANGSMLFQYESITTANSCTIGIENVDASDGLLVVYNSTYLTNGMAIRINTPVEDLPWYTFSPESGTIQPGEQQTITVAYNSDGMVLGTYEGGVMITGDDQNNPSIQVPVTMQIEFLPDPPANMRVNIVGNEAVFEWDPVPGASEYRLYYSLDGINFDFLLSTTDTTMSISTDDLGPYNYIYIYVTVL